MQYFIVQLSFQSLTYNIRVGDGWGVGGDGEWGMGGWGMDGGWVGMGCGGGEGRLKTKQNILPSQLLPN